MHSSSLVVLMCCTQERIANSGVVAVKAVLPHSHVYPAAWNALPEDLHTTVDPARVSKQFEGALFYFRF